MKLYNTSWGCYVEEGARYYPIAGERWDAVVNRQDLKGFLASVIGSAQSVEEIKDILAPVGCQDVWAAGVTYFSSKRARMAEAKDAGGGDFYDRVYSAARPELFFKSTAPHVAGTGSEVRIRRDASWSVPEPELTVLANGLGEIVGYTVGNDMSSRDIEGENPLYLPQAKVYDGSCALGPCVLVTGEALAPETPIRLEVLRGGQVEFAGETQLSAMKRPVTELVEYLFRENSFPLGVYLMTGTGIVPPDAFTLAVGDRVRITIDPIGTLENTVSKAG